MEDNFTRARLESTRRNKYLLKHLKNKTARDFITIYIDSNGTITPELLKVANFYKSLEMSSLDAHMCGFTQTITEEDVEAINKKIKENLSTNFIYFYSSYIRKIEQGYSQEYIENSLTDLKNAYFTYRKVNNPLWDLEDSQITLDEMKNLYNILAKKQKQYIIEKDLVEK